MLTALTGLPIFEPGDDLALLIRHALARADLSLEPGDVLVVTSKAVARVEGRFEDVSRVTPSAQAVELGARTGKDPRLVELILRESTGVSRVTGQAIVVRHRLGFIAANAGIDMSNTRPRGHGDGGPWALLLPLDPDASAERLRAALAPQGGVGVILSDSFGRPFRLGTVGVAVGLAGLPALWDQRGNPDLFGRTLEQTITALADQVAAAADLVAGQAAEGRPVVHVRGLRFPPGEHSARELVRPAKEDAYA